MNFGKSYAQISGSQFMLPNNFYAQMYNPSYMHSEKATEISIPGFAGLTFINQGSFKISDLITTSTGNPVIDFDHFYKQINARNFIRQDFSIPLFFFSKPFRKSVFSFYYKENFSFNLKFKDDVVEFLVNGNFAQGYHSFKSDDMNLLTKGYREFAFGFAKSWNKNLDVGLRAKFLLGSVYFNADNWNFGIDTAPFGDVVTLSSGGGGQMVLPFPVVLNENNSIYTIESKGAVQKYFGAYKNPGLAFDAGFTYYINDISLFSFSLRDLGGIWNRYNSFEMNQDENYDFIGFDLVSAVRYPEETGYTEPHILVKNVKDSVSQVYQPVVNINRFINGLGPKTVLHYQNQISDKLTLGITNQSAFNLKHIQNILTLSALQTWSDFSFLENLNLHGVSDISIGGGLQYESRHFQIFIATDNLFAIYHPAGNRTFSVTGGICLLLNSNKESKTSKSGFKKGKGETSKELPFYRKLNK